MYMESHCSRIIHQTDKLEDKVLVKRSNYDYCPVFIFSLNDNFLNHVTFKIIICACKMSQSFMGKINFV